MDVRRREFLAGAAGALAGISSLSLSFGEEKGGSERPNIILFMADDFGIECVGAHGGTPHKTPVLDKMAADGVRFDHCHTHLLQ